jgi:hypothetical protein
MATLRLVAAGMWLECRETTTTRSISAWDVSAMQEDEAKVFGWHQCDVRLALGRCMISFCVPALHSVL